MGVRFCTVDIDLDLAVLDSRLTPHDEMAGGIPPLCVAPFEPLSPVFFLRALGVDEDRREAEDSRPIRPRDAFDSPVVVFFPASSVDGYTLVGFVLPRPSLPYEDEDDCRVEELGLLRCRMEISLQLSFDDERRMLRDVSR